jgi:hypothetical protein
MHGQQAHHTDTTTPPYNPTQKMIKPQFQKTSLPKQPKTTTSKKPARAKNRPMKKRKLETSIETPTEENNMARIDRRTEKPFRQRIENPENTEKQNEIGRQKKRTLPTLRKHRSPGHSQQGV